MDQWQLVDGSIPVDGPEDFPRVTIRSEGQLREELRRLRDREPGIFALESPADDALQIGIGGPFWGMRHYRNREVHAVVLADRIDHEKRIDFAAEEDAIAFWPEELLPFERAIEVIIYYYRNLRLPDWIGWKEWDSARKQWNIKPATDARSA